jgi:hypothetical protein
MIARSTTRRTIKLAVLIGAFAAVAMGMSALFATAPASADAMNWDAVAQCESGGNWAANTGNGHFGGLQFKPATWSSNGGFGSPAMASREDQIRVAENVLASQGAGAWPTCGSRGGSPVLWDHRPPSDLLDVPQPAGDTGPAAWLNALPCGGPSVRVTAGRTPTGRRPRPGDASAPVREPAARRASPAHSRRRAGR